jgi:hypothetical protein
VKRDCTEQTLPEVEAATQQTFSSDVWVVKYYDGRVVAARPLWGRPIKSLDRDVLQELLDRKAGQLVASVVDQGPS